MSALICGSYAFDTIMVFPDRFKNHILPEQVHILNVSFLVPEMRREYGGCAGNIAYNLKLLGGEGKPMATVGTDFSSYGEVLDALDVVVQSAPVDVSGFSILEAMARGRPVVAFNTGTACEMLETGKTGILVQRGDVDGLAQAIEELAENTERAREMGQAARTKVAQDFNIKKVAGMILTFYARLCAAGGQPE